MSANLPVAVGDEATADLLNELSDSLWSASFLNTTGASPLTSTAGTPASITSGSFDFVSGYAYEIVITCRFSLTGGTTSVTEARTALFGIRRSSTSGTQIYNSGRLETITTEVVHFHSSQVVKCTSADTTQTLVFTGQFDNNLGIVTTAMNVTTNGSTTPARMTIKRIGLAANHADAIEIPTA
jgi:hypothetical protein